MKFTQHSNAVMVLAAMGLAGGCDSEQGFQYSVWFNTECPDYNCDVGVTVPMTAECVSEICANGAFKAGAPADLVANCDCTVNSSCQFTADTLLVGGETCACESISYLLGPGDPLPLAQDVEADVCTNMDDGSPDDYDGCYCEPALSQLGIDVAVQDLRDFFWANRVNPEASACSLQAVADCDGEEGCPVIEPSSPSPTSAWTSPSSRRAACPLERTSCSRSTL